MPCFKFEFGNSTVGPLGMVARVTAPDKATALRLLQERIENAYPGQDVNLHLGDAPVEYVNVYVNAEAMTLPIALIQFKGDYFSEYGQLMAGAAVSAVPTIVIFLMAQRMIIRSITMTGLKG